MEEMQQITLEQWMSWKEEIREKLKETAENFVHIGYRLKQIRDSGMLDGSADIFEFAQKEYGLSKSTTSRFIAINEKFSEGGNSLELRTEYKAIGSSKLAEMLTLPDTVCQMITDRTTVKEIRELKNFDRQQLTEENGENEELNPVQKCLVDYFKDKKEMLNAVMKAICEDKEKEAVELMNPSGYGTHKKGICFMFMYDYSTGVKAKILTETSPRTMPWKEVLAEIYDIYGYLHRDGEDDIHKSYYGEPEKEVKMVSESEPQNMEKTVKNLNTEPSVATSQQKAETDNNMNDSEDGGEEENGNTAVGDDEEAGNGSTEVEGDEVNSELRGEKCEAGTENELSDGSSPGTSGDGTEEQPEDQDNGNGQNGSSDKYIEDQLEETASAESDGGMTNDQIIEEIKSTIRNITPRILERIERDGDTSYWKNIKHKVNSLSCYIEQLIKYLEHPEMDKEEEEEEDDE